MTKTIVFICTGNACRSQMAEGFAKRALPGWRVLSAGTIASGVHETAIKVMGEEGIDITDQYSKTLDEVPVDEIERFVDELERSIQEQGDREIPSEAIGLKVMEYLRDLDDVAYVRFASVYRSFKDLKEFMSELQDLIQEDSGKGRRRGGR